MNRKTSLLLGYARRMEQVAALATEMQKIAERYKLEFGEDMTTDALSGVLTGNRLVKLASELRADAPAQPAQAEENVLEPVPVAPGAALGLAPAPQWLQDGLGDELTTAEQRAREEVPGV